MVKGKILSTPPPVSDMVVTILFGKYYCPLPNLTSEDGDPQIKESQTICPKSHGLMTNRRLSHHLTLKLGSSIKVVHHHFLSSGSSNPSLSSSSSFTTMGTQQSCLEKVI